MYTTVTTVRVNSLGPNQTANLTFEIPARLESSVGQLSISMVIPAATEVDLSSLLSTVTDLPYVGTIALQGTAGFDVSLSSATETAIYSGVFSENYLRSINGTVSHVLVKAGGSNVELTGLITHGLITQ